LDGLASCKGGERSMKRKDRRLLVKGRNPLPIIITFVGVIGAVAAIELEVFEKKEEPGSVAVAPKGDPIRTPEIAAPSAVIPSHVKKPPIPIKSGPIQDPDVSDDPAKFELPQKKAELQGFTGTRDLQIKKAGKTLDVAKALATKNQRADLGFKTGETLKNGCVALGFDLLGGYNYVVQPPDIPKDKLPKQIPDQVQDFHGKKVELRGFMLPIEVKEDGQVKLFFLMRDLASCCFGGYPKMNEWVLIKVPKTCKTKYSGYAPISVTGVISIGEELEIGRVTSIYRLNALSVRKMDEGS
jgi:hypothetical protein